MIISISTLIIAVLIWSALHSITASLTAKKLVGRYFGEHFATGWYRLLYNLVSLLTGGLLFLLALFLPNHTFYSFPSWLIIPALVMQLLSVLAASLSLLQVDVWNFVGLRQWQRWLNNLPPPQTAAPLTKTGLYAYMRHPLYFFSVLIMWFTPIMSVNLFTLFACFTLYFWIGSIFEERKLLAEFGLEYKNLQNTLPRIVPFTKWTKK